MQLYRTPLELFNGISSWYFTFSAVIMVVGFWVVVAMSSEVEPLSTEEGSQDKAGFAESCA